MFRTTKCALCPESGAGKMLCAAPHSGRRYGKRRTQTITTTGTTNRSRGASGPCRQGCFRLGHGPSAAGHDPSCEGGRDHATDRGCMCRFGCSSLIANCRRFGSATRRSAALSQCSGCSRRSRHCGSDHLRPSGRPQRLEQPRRKRKREEMM